MAQHYPLPMAPSQGHRQAKADAAIEHAALAVELSRQLRRRERGNGAVSEAELSASEAGLLCISVLRSYLDPAEWCALMTAADRGDWATCVAMVSGTFAVSADASPQGQAGLRPWLRRAVSAEPGLPHSWWIDPRVGDKWWAARSPREQWVELASFLTHVLRRLQDVAEEWADDSRAQLGMGMALCREGYVQEALMISTSDLSLALTDVLVEMLMLSGTLGPIKGRDGRAWCLMIEILEKGVGALFYGLTTTSFRTEVALKLVDYVRGRISMQETIEPPRTRARSN